MKRAIFSLIISFCFSVPAFSSDSVPLHENDATRIILDMFELPGVGKTKSFEQFRQLRNLKIRKFTDPGELRGLEFRTDKIKFRVNQRVDEGAYESLIRNPAVHAGKASLVTIGCKYTVGQPIRNWFSPFTTDCRVLNY